jgi:branched-chain amino acid aminotransferase
MLRQLRCRGVFSRSPATLRAALEKSYSIKAEAASTVSIQEVEPSKLSITKTTTPKELKNPKDLVFGRNFTGTKKQSLIQGAKN